MSRNLAPIINRKIGIKAKGYDNNYPDFDPVPVLKELKEKGLVTQATLQSKFGGKIDPFSKMVTDGLIEITRMTLQGLEVSEGDTGAIPAYKITEKGKQYMTSNKSIKTIVIPENVFEITEWAESLKQVLNERIITEINMVSEKMHNLPNGGFEPDSELDIYLQEVLACIQDAMLGLDDIVTLITENESFLMIENGYEESGYEESGYEEVDEFGYEIDDEVEEELY